jgi:hypothetical protein
MLTIDRQGSQLHHIAAVVVHAQFQEMLQCLTHSDVRQLPQTELMHS